VTNFPEPFSRLAAGDMERSVEFFTKVLSFEKISDAEVFGREYEHMQGVFGARLRITTLHAAKGPGIEFLEYLAPRDGRPAPQICAPTIWRIGRPNW
jgi:catechol 2,3-dioxygenase-like lactoylglutathione lyase family enzyme